MFSLDLPHDFERCSALLRGLRGPKTNKNCPVVKSVQSTLSHLQRPPEQMQSQRNYGSFLSKSCLSGMILLTMLAQNSPKSKRQCFSRAICYFKMVNIKQGEATAMCFEITWQVLILKAVLN